jgi:hypothetical protein
MVKCVSCLKFVSLSDYISNIIYSFNLNVEWYIFIQPSFMKR